MCLCKQKTAYEMRISDWSSDVCSAVLGVYTTLPQIIADELGADWRTVGAEAAPLHPLYANPIAAGELFGDLFDALPKGLHAQHAEHALLMLTAGSSSIRMRSEEHTSELQSLMRTSYAVFCLKKINEIL